MKVRIRAGLAGAVSIAVAASLAPLLVGTPVSAAPTAARDRQPNVIIILTDDQRTDTLQTMPVVRSQLLAKGADFDGVIPTAVCCPSRTSLLTGNNSHTTGVWTNNLRRGGWPAFHRSGYEKKTLATALDRAGYRTALFGKYLNYWNRAPRGFVPPGWDTFKAIWKGARGPGANAYYDYQLRGTEPPEVHGDRPRDYSTRVIGRHAVRFIADAEASNDPYLAFISTTGPHSPMTPDPADIGQWSPGVAYDNRAVNEADMSDKPAFLQDQPEVDPLAILRTQERTGQTLMSIDRLVDSVLDVADLSNTLVVFMSDNGLMWGEHRLVHKSVPYRWSTDVPLIMRWDGVIAPGDRGLATNTDVATTILDATGTSGAFATEGISLLSQERRRTVLEATRNHTRPAYCGVRTDRYLYVRYATSEQELYDYDVDPLELENVADDRQYADAQQRLRHAAVKLCDPVPPGFAW